MRFKLVALILLIVVIGLAQTPKTTPKPLDRVQVLALLAGGVSSQRVAQLVEQRGIDFEPSEDYIRILKGAGADEKVLIGLRNADRTRLAVPTPKAKSKQEQVEQRLSRGVELLQQMDAVGAEKQFRAALQLDANNALLHFALAASLYAKALLGKCEWEEVLAEYRTVTRLEPDLEAEPRYHVFLGMALAGKGDTDSAIGEYETALRYQTDLYIAPVKLGWLFQIKGDYHKAVSEFQAVIHGEPDNADAHYGLGLALANQGDADRAIPEYQAAVRMQPNLAGAHNDLGAALEKTGRREEAMAEYMAAIRLQPDLAIAHYNAANMLAWKGDWDGALAEYRTAVRLQPNWALGHQGLGAALTHKGDFQAALDELRIAYTLDPKDERIRKDYETLLQSMNPR